MKMMAKRSTETFHDFQRTTRRSNAEGLTLHNRRNENLKSYIALVHTDFAMKPSRGVGQSDTQ
jgi:hypothetical protein